MPAQYDEPVAADPAADRRKQNGSNGRVPAWLAALGIREGEYFSDAKPRWKRAMKARCFSPAARVYACLGLHTMAFQQELAVKMEAGKRVPLTPQDIAAQTGIRRDKVKLAVVEELEPWGLAKWEGSTKGQVKIYAWAVPKPVEREKIVPARGYNFDGIPADLLPFFKRFKWRPAPGFVPAREYFEEVEKAARVYQKAEIVLRAVIDRTRAPRQAPRQYKEERNERNSERNGGAAAAALRTDVQAGTSSSDVSTDVDPTTTATHPTEPQARQTESVGPPVISPEEFRQKATKLFATAKKPAPTELQLDQWLSALAPEARLAYLHDLQPRIGGFRHPGGIKEDLAAFVRDWPLKRESLLAAKREAAATEQRAQEARLRQHEEAIEEVRRQWPHLTPEEREPYREWLPELFERAKGAGEADA